jgi:hypothetical protein
LRAGEPAVTVDTNDFYVGIDSTLANNKFYGSSRYWTKETTSTGSGVNLVEGTSNGSEFITLKSPDSLSGITTYTFPATPTADYFLKTNATGTLSWAQVVSDFNIAADTGTPDNVSTGSTITFVGGTNVNTAVTDQTITINLDSGITVTDLVVTGIGTIQSANIEGGTIDATRIGVTTASTANFTVLDANLSDVGIATASDFFIDTTRVLYDDGSGITLAGIQTADATTKATLEALLGTEPNNFTNLNVSGITTTVTLNVTGNTTLGDASADTLTVNATATFGPSITGTISTATKLETARSFQITGDVASAPVFFDGSGNVGLAVTIQANSVALGTDTTGNYVEDVTAGDGLTKTSSAGEGQTVDLRVVTGAGITITSDAVAFKNAASLSNNALLKWTTASGQLSNSIISDDGTAATVTGNLVVTNDLYVNGSTTQINTKELTINDRTITLGIATGTTPSTTTWDLAVLMNYGDVGVAKTAGVIWDYSVERFVFSANSDNPSSEYNTTTPVITVATHAPIEIESLWVNDCQGQSQVISCTGGVRNLENITVDCGTF